MDRRCNTTSPVSCLTEGSTASPSLATTRPRSFSELYGALEVCRAHDLTIRVTGRDELGLMLRLAGFKVEAVYGGFEGEAFTARSDHLIMLARPL
jgi:hypothetical protein